MIASEPAPDVVLPLPRPLVVRFGAFGDMVILLSLVRALHERFGSPVDVVSSGAWTPALLERQPGIGTLYLIRSRKTPYVLSLDQWRLVRWLRSRPLGPVWNGDGDRHTRWLLAHARVPSSHIVDIRDLPSQTGEHAVDRMLRLSALTPRAFAASPSPSPIDVSLSVPPLVVAEDDRIEAEAWLDAQGLCDRPIVLVQAGNKRTMKWWRPRERGSNTKYWPESRWAQAIDLIAELEPDAEILLCGVASESALNRAILDEVRTNRVRSVAGNLPLGRLFALQERALGMISVDTGPAHSAAAIGTPLVVLFGTEDPNVYLPRSKTDVVFGLQGLDRGELSMLGISVKEVVDTWCRARAQSRERTEGWRAA